MRQEASTFLPHTAPARIGLSVFKRCYYKDKEASTHMIGLGRALCLIIVVIEYLIHPLILQKRGCFIRDEALYSPALLPKQRANLRGADLVGGNTDN